jgi:hypothetical protein
MLTPLVRWLAAGAEQFFRLAADDPWLTTVRGPALPREKVKRTIVGRLARPVGHL